MGTIAVVTQHQDEGRRTRYLVEALSRLWSADGHRVSICADAAKLPSADLAFLHVDLSVVPDAYREALRKYPVVINGGVVDIRKRAVSRQVVQRDSCWKGPVLIKTDLNAGGSPEWRAYLSDVARGLPAPEVPAPYSRYKLFRNLDVVPDEVWRDPSLVVERYLPERAGLGYCIRTWIFFGRQEYSVRRFGYHHIIKGHNTVRCEAAEVPSEMRAERERLNFDYGKFDFVMPNGVPILLDANKTPALGSRSPLGLHEHLAKGVDTYLRKLAPAHQERQAMRA